MKPIRKILVGFDFSEVCEGALRRALWLARKWEASLEVLHVLQNMPYEEARKDAGMVELIEQLEKEVSGELNNRVEAIVREQVKADTQVRLGTPYRDILFWADKSGADLIVVGSESQSGLKGLFLGRTAESVVRKSLIPVWVERKDFDTTPDLVLLPTDLSEHSRAAVLDGLEWARQIEAKVLLLHVVEVSFVPPFSLIDPKDFMGTMSELGQKKFGEFIQGLPLEGISYESHLAMGDPASEIKKVALDNKTALIVLGTHGFSGVPTKLMGSVASKVVQQAPCHVLSLRPSTLDLTWLKESFYSEE